MTEDEIERLASEHEKTMHELNFMVGRCNEIDQKVRSAGLENRTINDIIKSKAISQEEMSYLNRFEGLGRFFTWCESELAENLVQKIGRQFFTEPNLDEKSVKVFCVRCEKSQTWRVIESEFNDYVEWCQFHLITSEEECTVA